MPESIRPQIVEIQKKLSAELTNVIRQEEEPHITLAVAENVQTENIDILVQLLKSFFQDVTFQLKLGPVEQMVNHKGEGVLYLKAENEKLPKIYTTIRNLLEHYGGKFTFPDFKGHVTLLYLDKPIADAQLKNTNFNNIVNVTREYLKISVKDDDDWRRIGRLVISKRELIVNRVLRYFT